MGGTGGVYASRCCWALGPESCAEGFTVEASGGSGLSVSFRPEEQAASITTASRLQRRLRIIIRLGT
jgi:hypothetical protein